MSVTQVGIEKPASETKPLKMTYEEFLAWADEDTRAEWENGEVIIHQDLCASVSIRTCAHRAIRIENPS
jgi:hypothetical protein